MSTRERGAPAAEKLETFTGDSDLVDQACEVWAMRFLALGAMDAEEQVETDEAIGRKVHRDWHPPDGDSWECEARSVTHRARWHLLRLRFWQRVGARPPEQPPFGIEQLASAHDLDQFELDALLVLIVVAVAGVDQDVPLGAANLCSREPYRSAPTVADLIRIVGRGGATNLALGSRFTSRGRLLRAGLVEMGPPFPGAAVAVFLERTIALTPRAVASILGLPADAFDGATT